jgi:DNA-binding PadR family transcriptional regulator
VSPGEHALLGLLAMAEGRQPAYGYDLARQFADGQPLGEVLRLEPGMLYHHLKTLERQGWVDSTTEAQSTRPARRTFRLTPAGRAELDRWLSEPVARTREIRLEFLLKLYFAGALDPVRRAVLVREQRSVLTGLADSLERQLVDHVGNAATTGHHPATGFRRDVLRLRLAQTEAALGWINDAARGDDA